MHHKITSGVIKRLPNFFNLLRTQSFLVFGVLVRRKMVLLTKYEAHQPIISPFTDFVDQVPEYDW